MDPEFTQSKPATAVTKTPPKAGWHWSTRLVLVGLAIALLLGGIVGYLYYRLINRNLLTGWQGP